MSRNLIKVTRPAIDKLNSILTRDGKKAILFSVKGGGCNGFEYNFKPGDPNPKSEHVYEKDGLRVEVCPKSIFHLLGTEIDWHEDIMGQGFRFSNPMAGSSCGCGSSFAPADV
jgi:iron-sulfur cluster assembly accessory protein